MSESPQPGSETPNADPDLSSAVARREQAQVTPGNRQRTPLSIGTTDPGRLLGGLSNSNFENSPIHLHNNVYSKH